MRVRFKSMATVTAICAASVALTAAPASASSASWTNRNCGTTFFYAVTKEAAETTKGTSGSCVGHAWVRVKDKTGWYAWKNDSFRARIANGQIIASQHKGCGSCHVTTLYP